MPIEIKDIEYVEGIGHRIHAHLKGDNVVSFYGSLSNTAARLMKYGFIRIHKSYIINAEQIAFSKKNCVCLKSGAEVPISRNKIREFKIQYEKIRSADL